MTYQTSMARPRKHDTPVDPTSFRLSQRHLFALRFVARQRDISNNSAIEMVIERLANETTASRSWMDMWDEEESVRTLNLYALPEYRASTNEADARAFCLAHPQFFWADPQRRIPKRAFAVVLWPHVKELASAWKKKRDEDYHAGAKAMVALLKKAKLTPPEFG